MKRTLTFYNTNEIPQQIANFIRESAAAHRGYALSVLRGKREKAEYEHAAQTLEAVATDIANITLERRLSR